MAEHDTVNMRTLQSEARQYGITFKAGITKEDLYNLVQEAKSNDEMLKIAKESKSTEKSLKDITAGEKQWYDQMKLKRISMSSNMQSDTDAEGVQYSVKIVNPDLDAADKYINVSRFIPFDTVWMVEQCLLDSLKSEIFYRRKKYKNKNSIFGEDEGYKQIPSKKYNIEILDDMTLAELEELKHDQARSGSVDVKETGLV